jgi:hypothetical protein
VLGEPTADQLQELEPIGAVTFTTDRSIPLAIVTVARPVRVREAADVAMVQALLRLFQPGSPAHAVAAGNVSE